MKAIPCKDCGQPIVFLKTGKFKPDGKPQWAACNPGGVTEDDINFDWKRHQKHFLTCTSASAVKYREDYARKKAAVPAADSNSEIEF